MPGLRQNLGANPARVLYVACEPDELPGFGCLPCLHRIGGCDNASQLPYGSLKPAGGRRLSSGTDTIDQEPMTTESRRDTPPPGDRKAEPDEAPQGLLTPVPLDRRSIVLIGLMGAGKTTVGRRLAQRLGLSFVDADAEIERAAGETIPEIFERRGEATFRDGERRVIARLLEEGPRVLATGGGAFMDEATRANIAARGISVWLKADLDILMKRVGRRSGRPLLKQDDPRKVMERLMAQRYPVYALADIAVESIEGPHDGVVDLVIDAVKTYKSLSKENAG